MGRARPGAGVAADWGERLLRTDLFLLHRPVTRERLLWMKALVGLAVLQTLTGAAILAVYGWAQRPGASSVPIFWGDERAGLAGVAGAAGGVRGGPV